MRIYCTDSLCKKLAFRTLFRLLAKPMGGDNYIEFGWDTEVNPVLTHNASLTLCLLSPTKTRD